MNEFRRWAHSQYIYIIVGTKASLHILPAHFFSFFTFYSSFICAFVGHTALGLDFFQSEMNKYF